ncbi:MAG: hypothetical protein QNJ44_14385 [Rhodobacter sp.]|nr:hypothetical protein [Rhodobacter sp.]
MADVAGQSTESGRFRWKLVVVLAGLIAAALVGLSRFHGAAMIAPSEVETLYSASLTPPEAPLRVFHLGHSLVGPDLPAMVQQLAEPGHRYESQLGWGASLKTHWDPDVEIPGFAEENAHERYRDARAALLSGDYDAFVATEMVEIRDAIKYHDSSRYLGKWADLARRGNPDVRIYLYETWHQIHDPEGWLARLDRDLGRFWEAEILLPVLARQEAPDPIYVIPAGQVFAKFIRAVHEIGGTDDFSGKEGLIRTNSDGELDDVHLNDLGTYLVALTHYAVLYQKSPVGLPRQLRRADGGLAQAPSEETARLMQETVWQVVTSYPKTGVRQATNQ